MVSLVRRPRIGKKAHPRKGHITLQECSDLMGVTRERVRQIEEKALSKLRRAILADPSFATLVAEMFGDEVCEPVTYTGDNVSAEFQPGGFFEPKAPRKPAAKPIVKAIDTPAYVVEVLRVIGRSTVKAIHVASGQTMTQPQIVETLRKLVDDNTVSMQFRGTETHYRLVKGGAVCGQ